jgi:hypothetical protein
MPRKREGATARRQSLNSKEEVMSSKFRWWMPILSLSLAAVSLAAAGPGYHVTTTYKAGGEGGWDYLTVDANARRLYISRGTHVMVLDTDSGKSVGDIPDTPGVHGIALAPDLGRGFTSNGREGTVTIFDIKTLAAIGSKVKAGDNPDAILYDPATKRVFTFNGTQPGFHRHRRHQRQSPRHHQTRRQARVRRQRCQGRNLCQHRGQE